MWEKKCEELLRKHGETSVVISGINYIGGYSTYNIELCETNGAWNVEYDYDDNGELMFCYGGGGLQEHDYEDLKNALGD